MYVCDMNVERERESERERRRERKRVINGSHFGSSRNPPPA